MSKLSFRARALDCSKPMPVYDANELPDLSELATINRAVPQMPTGMEKEEEMELHFQQVLSAQQAMASSSSASLEHFDPENVVIPIPKVVTQDSGMFEELYRPEYRPPKQLIKAQTLLNLEPELPDYDLDSDDERWMVQQNEKGLELTALQFEKMMDRLERNSEYQVVKPEQAKTLLNDEDDDLVLAVYDYWLNKRLKLQVPLIPQVKTEKRDGTIVGNNPYYAFRRRAEKMQTRKNRKNDEESYEKMLRIRSDLRKAVTLLEMIKRREKSKRELLNLTVEVFERRYALEDWHDVVFNQLRQEAKPLFQFSKEELKALKRTREQQRSLSDFNSSGGEGSSTPPRKRGKHAASSRTTDRTDNRNEIVSQEWLKKNEEEWNKPSMFPGSSLRLQQEEIASRIGFEGKSTEEADNADGRYAFRRKRGCLYQADSVCCGLPTEGSLEEPRSLLCPTHFKPLPYDVELEQQPSTSFEFPADINYASAKSKPWLSPVFKNNNRFTHAYLHSRSSPNRLSYVGLVRRRIGRGGRVVIDRLHWPNEVANSDPAGLMKLNSDIRSDAVDLIEPQPSTSAACSSSIQFQTFDVANASSAFGRLSFDDASQIADSSSAAFSVCQGSAFTGHRASQQAVREKSLPRSSSTSLPSQLSIFRPESPVTMDLEQLIDNALDFTNSDGWQLTRGEDPLWNSGALETVAPPTSDSKLYASSSNTDLPGASSGGTSIPTATASTEGDGNLLLPPQHSSDVWPASSSFSGLFAIRMGPPDGKPTVVPFRVGVPACAYELHLDHIAAWQQRQKAVQIAADDSTNSRARLLIGTKPAVVVPLQDASLTSRVMDGESAYLACSALMAESDVSNFVDFVNKDRGSGTFASVVSTNLVDSDNAYNCDSTEIVPASQARSLASSASTSNSAKDLSALTGTGGGEHQREVSTPMGVASHVTLPASASSRANTHSYSKQPPPNNGRLIAHQQSFNGSSGNVYVMNLAPTSINGRMSLKAAANSKHGSPVVSNCSSRSNSPVDSAFLTKHPQHLTRVSLPTSALTKIAPKPSSSVTLVNGGGSSTVSLVSADEDMLPAASAYTSPFQFALDVHHRHHSSFEVGAAAPRTSVVSQSVGARSVRGRNNNRNYLHVHSDRFVDSVDAVISSVTVENGEVYCPDSPLATAPSEITYPLPTPSPSPNARPTVNGDAGPFVLLKQTSTNNGGLFGSFQPTTSALDVNGRKLSNVSSTNNNNNKKVVVSSNSALTPKTGIT